MTRNIRGASAATIAVAMVGGLWASPTLAVPAAATAQTDATTTVGELVVAAEKREQKLESIPAAVLAYTSWDRDLRGIAVRCSEASATKSGASKPPALPRVRRTVGKDVKDGPVVLPRGAPGIEFDDIQFGAGLRKVIVPAGRTGSVVLIDPDTSAVTEIEGLTRSDQYTPVPVQSAVRAGHRYGSTAATEAGKYVAAIDGTTQTLHILDPVAATIVASVALNSASDYLHYVPSRHELWVTNPRGKTIELFAVPASGNPVPQKVGTIAIAGGPSRWSSMRRAGAPIPTPSGAERPSRLT